MKASKPRFLTNEPALLVGKALVVSDLHIGIEKDFYDSGIKLPSQTGAMKKRIEKLLTSTKARTLIVLGDVKHRIPGVSFQEMREVPEFLNYFDGKVKVIMIMGNHDPGIEKLIPNIETRKDLLLEGVYLLHGHTKPSGKMEGAGTIVMGHVQPMIEFRDRLGYYWRERAWVRARSSGKELIVMPSFNPFSGGCPLNSKRPPDREHRTPLMKKSELGRARIYLLDGTYLGELGKL